MSDSRKPDPIFSRKDRVRMFTLMGSLLLILVAMQFAARPSSWYWLTGDPAEQANDESESLAGTTAPLQAAKPQALAPDELLSPAQTASDSRPDGGVNAEPPPDDPELNRGKEETAGQAIVPTRPFITVKDSLLLRPGLLDSVTDKTGFIGVREADAYHQILALVNEVPEEELTDAAQESVAYASLEAEPSRYRGRLLSIFGSLHGIYKLNPLPPEYGGDELYECWIRNDDSDVKLYRIVTRTVPEELPIGEPLSRPVPVRTAGYFFKIYGYPIAPKGSQTAPLILANSVELLPPKPGMVVPKERGTHIALTLTGLLLGVIVIAGIVAWRSQSGDRRFDREYKRRVGAATDEERDALANLDADSPEDFLGTLSGKPDSSA